MSDTMVALVADVKIAAYAPRLASTMQLGYIRSLKGVKLQQLLFKEDRQKIEDRVQTPTFNMEVFLVHVASSGSTTSHLIDLSSRRGPDQAPRPEFTVDTCPR